MQARQITTAFTLVRHATGRRDADNSNEPAATCGERLETYDLIEPAGRNKKGAEKGALESRFNLRPPGQYGGRPPASGPKPRDFHFLSAG
jgi:hypothetical protein